ncbi:MAG: CARDB domain-containing protein [Fimbriiglobus sp.]
MPLFWKRFALGFCALSLLSYATYNLTAGEPKVAPDVPSQIIPADAVVSITNGVTPVQAVEPIRPEAAVSLEWSGPPVVKINQTNKYTLSVKNISGQPLQKMTVQVRAAKGATITAEKPAVAAMDGVYIWELASLDIKQSQDFPIVVKPTLPGETGCQAWVTFTGTAAMKVQVQNPQLAVTITSPKTAILGETFPVTYSVKNVGNCAVENVNVSINGFDKTSVYTIPKLQPGEVEWRQGNATSTTGGEKPYQIDAKAADCVDVAATSKTLIQVPQLNIAITGPKETMVQRATPYVVRVSNPGNAPVALDGVQLQFPPQWLVVNPEAYSKTINSLPKLLGPGQHTEFTFDARASTSGVGQWGAIATGSRLTARADCQTKVTGIPALRMELVDVIDPVEKGQETTYEIRITNTGTQADTNIVLTCPLPEQFKFVSASGPTKFSVTDLNQCAMVKFEPIRELAPKTEAVFKITVKAAANGDIRFKAQMNSQTLTTSVVKEESTRVYGE